MTAKTEGLRVNVTPEMRHAIEQAAVAEDVSTATIIRWALTLWLTVPRAAAAAVAEFNHPEETP